jgi:hypothetical protein
VDPVYVLGIAAPLFDLFESIELQESHAPCFPPLYTLGDVLVGLQLNMVPQFRVQLLICLSGSK